MAQYHPELLLEYWDRQGRNYAYLTDYIFTAASRYKLNNMIFVLIGGASVTLSCLEGSPFSFGGIFHYINEVPFIFRERERRPFDVLNQEAQSIRVIKDQSLKRTFALDNDAIFLSDNITIRRRKKT